MKRICAACLLATLLSGLASHSSGARTTWDYLVPVEKETGSGAAYEKVWREKLLVTNGELARFVGLPGNVGEETSVSVYRRTGQSGDGQYWLTATQASKRLWDAIEGTLDAKAVGVQRCDAPLPESTALAIHRVWIAMLSQVRPEPKSEQSIAVDTSTEIFSAAGSDGRLLQGQLSSEPGKNSSALLQLAFSLMKYCDVPQSERANKAREIEREATDLLNRVSEQ
jgi:hypothetical protein